MHVKAQGKLFTQADSAPVQWQLLQINFHAVGEPVLQRICFASCEMPAAAFSIPIRTFYAN